MELSSSFPELVCWLDLSWKLVCLTSSPNWSIVAVPPDLFLTRGWSAQSDPPWKWSLLSPAGLDLLAGCFPEAGLYHQVSLRAVPILLHPGGHLEPPDWLAGAVFFLPGDYLQSHNLLADCVFFLPKAGLHKPLEPSGPLAGAVVFLPEAGLPNLVILSCI